MCATAPPGAMAGSTPSPSPSTTSRAAWPWPTTGNLTNSFALRQELELQGSIFHTTSDTEVISYLTTKERLTAPSIEQALNRAMHRIQGAYSLVVMSPSKLLAVRDPQGLPSPVLRQNRRRGLRGGLGELRFGRRRRPASSGMCARGRFWSFPPRGSTPSWITAARTV